MNLNNSKYNYARKFKAILKYVLFAVPLIMVLVAVLFPIKTTSNDYDVTTVETVTGDTTINFNQLAKNNNLNYYDSTYWYKVRVNVTQESNYIKIIKNESAAASIQQSINVSVGHKYLFKYKIEKPLDSDGYSYIYPTSNLGNIIDYSVPQDLSEKSFILQAIESMQYITIRLYLYGGSNNYVNLYKVQAYDITQMGLDNISVNDFNELFPLYYDYTESKDITIDSVTITNTISSGEEVLEVTEDKQFNTSLLIPMTKFYGAGINSWYESFLIAFELNYETTSYMYYLVHMPLWIMYVVLLDLLLDIVLLVPCLLHRLVYKYKGDE